ncbi:MAG TPA: APC family permease [Thermoanaerobaculia bacterium]|nr:APC family permease [Thermoanaerobaculia bacterium]
MPLRELTKRVFLGKSRDPLDPHVFHQLSLVAFLAWVGLGADGLSSSCYGPEELFVNLGSHRQLAVFLAVATALTVVVISVSYSQIIELFPSGGGGYLVATSLLGPGAGVVSGSALVVDYAMTIAMQVAACVAALSSLTAGVSPRLQLIFSLALVVFLILINLRGVKESVLVLLPIFLLFLVTHILVIAFGIGRHVGAMPELVATTVRETKQTWTTLGGLGTLALMLKAFSMGGGTYTGLEAVSNGLQVLREPRVKTGRKTMTYMAISLSVTAGGLILCYLLADVFRQEGQTLNAVLVRKLSGEAFGPGAVATSFVLLTLLAEGALLFVGAQAGFLDGPRVLSNMAIDSWVPHRFSLLSERLVTQNGILVMGLSAIGILLYTGGSIDVIVVMYSINVFLTFSLSQLGMCVHWWQERKTEASWGRRFAINGVGLLTTATILVVTVVMKFREGGWVTVLITGSLIGVCVAVRRHYSSIGLLMKRADDVLTTLPRYKPADISGVTPKAEPVSRNTPTAVFLVSGFNGLGIHSLLQVQKYFPRYFKNAVFLSVGVVDSTKFKGIHEVENLKKETERDLNKYVEFARGLGMHAEHHYAVGTDLLDEIVRLCKEVKERYDRPIFFASKLIFPDENMANRLLHNQTPFAVQRRLQFEGMQTVILPIQVST